MKTKTKSGAWLVAALSLLGCGAGEGTGTVMGNLFILDCREDNGHPVDIGAPDALAMFNLQPRFFGAEPIDDIGLGLKANRLIVRLQTSGRQREVNDTLQFDFPNSREVARCVRGRVDASGAPDYDPVNCFQGPDGPRLRVAPDALVRASFFPRGTCSDGHGGGSVITGTAVADPRQPNDGAWTSFIVLTQFGTAAQTMPPEMRAVVSDAFKVDFDQPMVSPTFQLDLVDDTLVYAQRYGQIPPQPRIGGQLNGNFDFKITRGQGAQTFP